MRTSKVYAERYVAWDVAQKLDALFDDAMLAGDVEVATRHLDITTAA